MSRISIEQLILNSGLLTATGNSLYFNGLNVGNATGSFYPLIGNPSGYITTGQTGSLFINTGSLTGAFYPLYSNPSGYITGITGNFISANQTGQFYAASNPASYATSGNLQSTGSILYNDIIGLSGNYTPTQNYNLNINWAASNTFWTILTGNPTFNFSNQKDGQTIVVSVSNTGNAPYSGFWPTTIKWAGQTIPPQTTGSFTDIYTFINITGAIYGSAVQGF